VFAGFFQDTNLLAQLVAARFELLGCCDGLAPPLVEGAKIAQQRIRVSPPRAQSLFNCFQARTDKSQVEHRSSSLNDGAGPSRCSSGLLLLSGRAGNFRNADTPPP